MLNDLQGIDGFWYLATPYTKYPSGHDKAALDAAVITSELMKRNINVFSPIVHSHSLVKFGTLAPFATNFDFWMWADGAFMNAAHGLIVAMMESWRDSKGVNEEIKRFQEADKHIVYLDPKELGL